VNDREIHADRREGWLLRGGYTGGDDLPRPHATAELARLAAEPDPAAAGEPLNHPTGDLHGPTQDLLDRAAGFGRVDGMAKPAFPAFHAYP
jgi:hypothetical protein